MTNSEKKLKANQFENIYAVVELIPFGRVTSYGAIASYLGVNGGARLVGWAMNALNGNSAIPAHRVLNKNGILTGKHAFERPTDMKEKLEAEGLMVEDDQVIDFQKHFWDPSKALL